MKTNLQKIALKLLDENVPSGAKIDIINDLCPFDALMVGLEIAKETLYQTITKPEAASEL